MTEAIRYSEVRPTAAVRERMLLTAGALAGPIFVGSALAQGFSRDGFDFRRHPVSVLSNGDLGWIQIATFAVTGLLVVGAALPLRRTAAGSTWLPRLLSLHGVGLVAAGIFSADPGDGFPAGTPRGPGAISWHGGLHFLAGAVAFVALIVATVGAARRAHRRGESGRAGYSLATGAFFAVAWIAMIVRPEPVTMVGFGLAVLAGWVWVSATFIRATNGATV